MNTFVIFLITGSCAIPLNLVQKVAENDFENLDNYLPKPGEFFRYNTFAGDDTKEDNLLDVIEFKSVDDGNSGIFTGEDSARKESLIVQKETLKVSSTEMPETTTIEPETTTILDETTTVQELQQKNFLDPVLLDENGNSTINRTARQESEESNEVDGTGDDSKEKENQDFDDDDEEEPNMITGLISAFLGGLSRPDGSVDVEAITGLLGSLSTQNPDGTYDFSGLTELLMSFFGGTGEEGGGSNFGAFIGGLLGAFLQGIANPPGAKGSGIFLGNFLTAILPGLSAPAPAEEGATTLKPQPAVDSGGFLGGLLQSVLPSLGSLSGGSSGGNDGGGGSNNKFSLFKALFSSITRIFSSSSSTAW